MFRLLMHPWEYIGHRDGIPAAIIDANGKLVVTEDKVSVVVFDAIWALYFDYLRE